MTTKPYRKELAGIKFNYLTAVSYEGKASSGAALWRFLCDCGTENVILAYNVQNGSTKSCGCQRVRLCGASNVTHGMKNTPEHGAWAAINSRCTNPKNKDYERYSGRRPTKSFSFEEFYACIGPRPTKHHSVDRIDNTKPYDVGNIRWATLVEQANNRKDNILVSYNGEIVSLKAACRLAGYSYTKALQRFTQTKDMAHASENLFQLVSGGRHA